jgi:hypothetical protein
MTTTDLSAAGPFSPALGTVPSITVSSPHPSLDGVFPAPTLSLALADNTCSFQAPTGDFLTEASFTTAENIIVTCIVSVNHQCVAKATVEPCYCQNLNGWISDQNACYASGNAEAGTSIWPIVDTTYYSFETEQCSNPRTVSHYGGFTTPKLTSATPTSVILSYAPVSFVTTPTPTTSYPPLSSTWNNNGPLNVGYCGTPEFQIYDAGQTALWAPAVGCANNKPDCCPFGSAANVAGNGFIPGTTTTAASTSTSTVNVGADGQTLSAGPSGYAAGQVFLDKCPQDYASVSGGCCPS